MSFEGKNLYGQYIDYSEKKKWPKGPYTGTIFYIIRIYSRSQVSVYRTIGPLVFLHCRQQSYTCITNEMLFDNKSGMLNWHCQFSVKLLVTSYVSV